MEAVLSRTLAISIPTDYISKFHHYLALSAFIVCRLVTMAILIGWIWFLVVILIDISPVIIRVAEYLVLSFGLFFFFPKRVWGKLTFEIGFLKVDCAWNLFLQYLLQDLSWGQLSFTAPQAFWTGSASKHWCASCSSRKCPQGGSTPSCPTLVPPATRASGKMASWAVN